MKKVYIIVSLLICVFSFLISIRADSKKFGIIIDPGHGGRDGGATVNGIVEAEVNLAVAEELKKVYEEKGYIVDMTRTENVDLCENTFVKREDMNRRVKKINSGNYVFCISIHQNTYSDSKYKGAQVFYNEKNHSLNKELAEGVQFSLRTYLKNTTRTVVNRNNIYLLNKVTIPIIIVECGFLTNVEEAHQLISSDYQKKLAYSIYYGSRCILDKSLF